ncbi:MAG: hypothetical protein DMD30_08190, partial [Gemmatimonadetes bacterium]
AYASLFYCIAERLSGSEEMFLANELFEGAWAHPRGERLRGFAGAPETFFSGGEVGGRTAEFFWHCGGYH